MKLRRVSAAVATTAVLAPAALLAAPVAHAAPTAVPNAPASAATMTVAADSPPVTEGTPEAPAPSTEPSTPAPAPGGPGTAPGDGSGEPAPGGDGEEEPPVEEPGKQPGSEPGGKTGVEESDRNTDDPAEGDGGGEEAEDPSEDPGELDECADDEIAEDPELSTTLHGLPSRVAAGSGFHSFTYKVTNRSDRTYKRVDFGVFAGTVHGEDLEDTGRYLTLQFKNPDTGAWENVSTDGGDEDAGHLGFTDVRPHETLSLDLRLSVAAEAPEGLGFALSVGAYVDEDGACFLSTGDYYEFDVLEAGTRPGKVPGAQPRGTEPQGGKKPLPGKPAGDKEINPVGTLADTGSSDVLPAFALVGAAAVAVGAGAVFAVHRRRPGGAEA